MNKKLWIIISAVVLVVVLGSAYMLYKTLYDDFAGDTLGVVQPAGGTSSGAGAAAGSAGGGSSGQAASASDNRIEAPDFTVFDADGNEVRLSDFKGKPVVVNFWASWCPPCKAELPDFQKVYDETGEDVVFLMVNLVDGQRETLEIATRFVEENGYTFPVYYDTNQDAAIAYGISSIPTTLMIDKDGYIVTGQQGQINEAALRKGIGMITG